MRPVKHGKKSDQTHRALDKIFETLPIPFPPTVSFRLAEKERLAVHFSPRERQVGGWVAEGKSDSVIAKILGLGLRTVHTRVEGLLYKTGLENRGAFIAWVWRTRFDAQIGQVEKWKPVKYK